MPTLRRQWARRGTHAVEFAMHDSLAAATPPEMTDLQSRGHGQMIDEDSDYYREMSGALTFGSSACVPAEHGDS
jgi:hypothetical protein